MTWDQLIHTFDERRDIALPGDRDATLQFCVEHFTHRATDAIRKRGAFYAALSGGSTPKALFELLQKEEYSSLVDWEKVFLFWSDERSVSPDDPDSNYHMAMSSGFSTIPIPHENIFRMHAETDIEANAEAYAKLIQKTVPNSHFDLIMLGMGDDGHTASLFPHTDALTISDTLVAANYVTQKDTWRMTFTYPCINNAKHIAVYVLGESKKDILHTVLNGEFKPVDYPSQKLGTALSPALWIVDKAAAKKLDHSY